MGPSLIHDDMSKGPVSSAGHCEFMSVMAVCHVNILIRFACGLFPGPASGTKADLGED